MGKIQSQLIRPLALKLREDWQAVFDQSAQLSSSESRQLALLAAASLEKIHRLLSKQNAGAVPNEDNIYETLRDLKKDLRTLQRRLHRHTITAERIKSRFLSRQTRVIASFNSQGH